MSFKSYTFCKAPDGILALDDPQPLMFSGKNGLIARYVIRAGDRGEGPWRLTPAEVHALIVPTLGTAERLIVFEQTEQNQLELMELEAIHGVSSDRTEMMFRFRPLVVLNHAPGLQVRHATGGKIYTEELSLEGGAMALLGTWQWRRPHLAIGGVVCGAAPLR